MKRRLLRKQHTPCDRAYCPWERLKGRSHLVRP